MNIIEIEKLLIEKFGDSEYLKKYIDICSNNDDDTIEYCEGHHILPVSVFPEYESFTLHPWNKVKLNYVNHCRAHYFFAMATNECWWGVHSMLYMKKRKRKNSVKKLTEAEVIELATIGAELKANYSNADETRAKIGAAHKGKIVSDETRAKQSAAKKGKKYTEEARANMATSQKEAQNRPEVRAKKSATLRKAPHWALYDELYRFWLNNGKFKCGNFRKLAVANGYPDVLYRRMVIQFNLDSNHA